MVMKKLIVTENQFNMLSNKLIVEADDSRYHREIEVSVWQGRNVKFKGMEINDITCTSSKTPVSFTIDQEHRSWGIKDINISDIKGYEALEFEVEYFTDESNTETETITLPLDWTNLEKDHIEDRGVITVGDELSITLENDESGNLMISHMNLEVYTL